MRKNNIIWIILTVCSLVVICSFLFLAFFYTPAYTQEISITIPAGSTDEIIYQEDYYYSDVNFSPVRDSISIYAGQDLGDSMVVLLPVSCREENAYEPTYITPGLEIEMDVEKGAVFKVGVAEQNLSDTDITVTLTIEGIKLIDE